MTNQSTLLPFGDSNISSWGPGISTGFDWSFRNTFSAPYYKSLTLPLPGPDLSLSASFDAGIGGGIRATLGSFDLSYPMTVEARFPSAVAAGQTFTIDTSNYRVNSAKLDLTGPRLAADFNIFLKGGVSLDYGNTSLADASYHLDASLGLQDADLEGIYGSLKLDAPAPFEKSVTLAGGYGSLQSITAAAQGNPFLTADLDIDQFARTLFPQIPKVDGKLETPVVKMKWDLLDVDAVGSLSLAQAVTFQPTGVNVDFSYAGQHQFGRLGDSFTFTAPNSGNGEMQLIARYSLIGTVTTRTGIVGNFLFSIEALKAEYDTYLLGAKLGHFETGAEIRLPTNGFSTGLQNWNSLVSTFSETVGSSYPATYVISYSDLTPPPPPPPSTDDYPLESPQTTGRVPVNTTAVQGTIEIPADRDWFRLDLTANQHYRFELAGQAAGSGLTLLNPIMSLRQLSDPAKKVLIANSNGQPAAVLDYTPIATETIFIVAGGDLVTGGTYSLKATTIGGTGPLTPIVGTPTPLPPPPVAPTPPPPDPRTSAIFLSIADNSIREGNDGTTILSFGVVLSGPGAGTRAVSVQYTTEDIANSSAPALAGQDYIAKSSIFTIPAGEIAGTIDIKVFGETFLESDEVFRLALSQPSTNVSLLQSFATGFINNDDNAPNHRPITKFDMAITAPDTPVTMDVLANDSDPDGDSLTIGQVFSVTSGASVVATDNNHKILVTPAPGFTGIINFGYVADDGKPEGQANQYVGRVLVFGDGTTGIVDLGTVGDDILSGDGGNDTLSGGFGDDTILGSPGADRIDGGAGFDYLDLRQANHAASIQFHDDWTWDDGDGGKDVLNNIEGVWGTPFNDLFDANYGSVVGNAAGYRFYGFDGDDRLAGDAGDDILDGGTGNDQLESGAGRDVVYGGDGNDNLSTDPRGEDTVSDILDGGIGDDHIWAGAPSADHLYGGAGNDQFAFGNGDIVSGGSGSDIFYLQGLNLSVPLEAWITDLEPGDVIRSRFYLPVLSEDKNNLFWFIAPITLGSGVTTGLDHVEFASAAGESVLYFGYDAIPGADYILRLAGTFTIDQFETSFYSSNVVDFKLLGGFSGDSLFGGTPTGTIASEVTYALGPNDANLVLQDAGGAIDGFGNGSANTLTGNASDNRLMGNGGGDSLVGGGGVDTAVFSGSFTSSSFSFGPDSFHVTGPDGVDTLRSIEFLQFDDGKVEVTPTSVGSSLTIAAMATTKAEGQAGTTLFTFTVTRSGATTLAQQVAWKVSGANGAGTVAADALDFDGGILPTGSISFASGEISKTISINVTADTLPELNERFAVTLFNPTPGAVISSATAQGIIRNDDATLSIAALNSSKPEGNGTTTPFTFTVTRTGDTTKTHSAKWSVAGTTGTGTQPADAKDFAGGLLPTGTISFAAGETAKTLTIPVAADALGEVNERFAVTLAAPSTGASLGTATAGAIILNDDTSLAITPTGISRAEGNVGTNAFTYTVRRGGTLTGTTKVNWTLTPGGVAGTVAVNAADFIGGVLPSGGALTFTAGQTSQKITLNIVGDTAPELNESFTLTLSNPTPGVNITTANAKVAILDDDTIYGTIGNNTLVGTPGPDLFIIGQGQDSITGGLGRDTFRFLPTAVAPANAFTFEDFSRAAGEKLDLSRIDAVPGGPDNLFTFIGTAAFTGTPGELRYTDTGPTRLIQANTNSDLLADLTIIVKAPGPVDAAWFVL